MDFLEEEFNEILKIFQLESEEIISRLNQNLLDLERKPSNKDAIFLLFRDAHSLKGASRMVGFNNVQTLAHKMEDILGLAKDNKINLNTQVVNVLYKTVDLLSDVITKSIDKKHEVHSETLIQQIETLDNINELVDTYQRDEKVEFDVNSLGQNIQVINNLITESLFILMKIEINKCSDSIEALINTIQELYDIFEKIELFDVKKGLGDIKIKLDFVKSGTHNLTNEEIERLHQQLNEIIVYLTSICEIYNIKVDDYYSIVFEKLAKEPKTKTLECQSSSGLDEEIKTPSTSEIIVYTPIFDLSLVKEKLLTINQNIGSYAEIKKLLADYLKNTDDGTITHILEIIISIFDYVEKNEIQMDEETIAVMILSLDYCDNILKKETETVDKRLIIQQLEIVQQVLELKENKEDEVLNFVQEQEKKIIPKRDKTYSTLFDTAEIKTLRVDSLKLDSLVNQVGELMVTKIKSKKHRHELSKINNNLEDWQRTSQKVLKYLNHYNKKHFGTSEYIDTPTSFIMKQFINLFSENNQKFAETISNISTLNRAIQEDELKMDLIADDLDSAVKSIRVLPLATIFHLFGRMVRDIAQEKKKIIELEIIGSETNTDKKIIEEIKTPLIHIIRNSIDHGIETPDERTRNGKPPEGKITLSASHVDNNIVIEIKDDGRGINLEKIKEKALKNGYLSEEELNSMTDEQITNIIFAPGFSTGEEITNISGRGIGLDVVQTKIAQLNGKVHVISELNKGCCVRIELPTTMSTLKAFLVQSSNQTFAIPLAAINKVVWKKKEEIFSNEDNRSIVQEDKTIPVYNLSDILNLAAEFKKTPTKETARETILIIKSENKTIGLSIDKLIGDQEILHKKLSAPLYRLKNISGVTTLDTGEICLILSVHDLLKTISTPKQLNAVSVKNLTQIKRKEDYNILLVDDSNTTRTLEKNILTNAGYQIDVAVDPIEALNKMKVNNFDLIISDIEMPEMNGLEFLYKIKTDEMYNEIPVLIMSSKSDEEIVQQARNFGAIDYIVKSDFNQTDFLEKVNTIFEKQNEG